MDLHITKSNNLFQLRGIFQRANIHQFKREFLNIFDKQYAITLNIENLTSIDHYGVNALAQLHNEAITKGKKLSIIGMGCDDLYEHFKSEETAA
jgi:anti-anti-sigma regulatory factor